MSELFDKFEPVSAKQGKQKIQHDLKGADYNDTLVWNSPDGIDVKPFYHPDGYEAIDVPSRFSDTWSIAQNPCHAGTHAQEVAKLANDATNRGAQMLFHIAAPTTRSISS